MSLRQLPAVRAFSELDGIRWEAPDDAVEAFDPSLIAADGEDDATISIYGEIGRDFMTGADNTERRVAAALRSIGKRAVTVNINSPGGSFLSGLAIYNVLREHSAKVTVKVMAMAGSAASLIAMAGDEIKIAKAGFIMVHDASVVALGNRHILAGAVDMLKEIDAAMATIYADRAGVDEAKAAAWMDERQGQGTMFRGERAIEAGLADSVLPADEVKSTPEGKRLKAVALLERALRAQGMSRDEARSLIGEIATGRPAVADAHRSAVASAELAASLRGLFTR